MHVHKAEIYLQNNSVNLGQIGLQQQDNAAWNNIKLTSQTWSTKFNGIPKTRVVNAARRCKQTTLIFMPRMRPCQKKSPSQNWWKIGSTLVKDSLLKFQSPEILTSLNFDQIWSTLQLEKIVLLSHMWRERSQKICTESRWVKEIWMWCDARMRRTHPLFIWNFEGSLTLTNFP